MPSTPSTGSGTEVQGTEVAGAENSGSAPVVELVETIV